MAPPVKGWVRVMGAAKWIRLAMLLLFAGVFAWLAFVRGEAIWLLPCAIFAGFGVLAFRR